MYNSKKIVVVMPAYNAALTLDATFNDIDHSLVDEIVLVDDASRDDTVHVAQKLGIKNIIVHDKNKGYGGNQKTCYDTALKLGADIVIMLHPDYQYTPKLIPAMCSIIGQGIYPVVLASRILGNGAKRGGMPGYKYFFNRVLTFIQNVLCGQKLSEYHTGYRAFSKEVLKNIPYHNNSDDFVFDNEMLAQIFASGYEVGEVTCPTKYFKEASSINFSRSVTYGMGVLRVSINHRLYLWGILKNTIYIGLVKNIAKVERK